jgi:hypothetical protein
VSGLFRRPSYTKPIVLSQNTIFNFYHLLFISALVAEGEEVAAVIEEVIAGTEAAVVGVGTAEVMAEARAVTVAEAAVDIEVVHRRDDRRRHISEGEGVVPEGVVGIIVLDPDLILHVS